MARRRHSLGLPKALEPVEAILPPLCPPPPPACGNSLQRVVSRGGSELLRNETQCHKLRFTRKEEPPKKVSEGIDPTKPDHPLLLLLLLPAMMAGGGGAYIIYLLQHVDKDRNLVVSLLKGISKREKLAELERTTRGKNLAG